MSKSAFSLLSAGISFKNIRDNEKKLFEKGKPKRTVSRIQNSIIEIPSTIDFFNYDKTSENTKLRNETKREKRERKNSLELQRERSDSNASEKMESVLGTEEKINEFRHRMHISVSGGDIPSPIPTFDAIPFRKDQSSLKHLILRNIEEFEFKEPTPIQMQAIPIAMCNRDLLGIAPTGSGKTAAYLIPLIQRLETPQQNHIRVIILVPTIELAGQVHRHMTRLCNGRKLKVVVLSKSSIAGEINQSVPVDCLISTPLRLISTITSSKIAFDKVEVLVMDEGDKLFEEGFIEQVDTILSACCNPHLQRLLFSATLPPGVESMARTVLRDPIRVVVGVRNSGNENVDQSLMYCGREEGKLIALRNIIRDGFQPPMLVFVQSKERAKQLYTELAYDKINVDVIHSDLSLTARNNAVTRFRTGESWVLIATDLLARGLDFLGLNTVVNYDFPQSGVEYIHRIGRTGRAGRSGKSITLFTEEDKPMLRSIANVMKLSGCDVPEWMLQLKKISKNDRKRMETHAVKREAISTQSKFDKKRKVSDRKKKLQKGKVVRKEIKSVDAEPDQSEEDAALLE